MNIKIEGQKLLDSHSDLNRPLNELLENRELTYRVEINDDLVIAKPRFKKPLLEWPPKLLKDVHDHLQYIWNFFYYHSFWFDNTILPLISTDLRRVSKRSIIFLLEKDVWETDEVYGDYLINKNEVNSNISYFRRNKKIREFTLETIEDIEIEEWICNDIINQLKEQFEFLWSKLESEIQVCIYEKFHKKQKLDFTPDYLKEQLDKTNQISEVWPEAALLNLGRIVEFWLLHSLGKKETPWTEDLIRSAQISGIIKKAESRFLKEIRNNYNRIKHRTYYKADKDEVLKLINGFYNIFS